MGSGVETMNRVATAVLFAALIALPAFAVGKGKARYLGGTIAMKGKKEAPFELGPDSFSLSPKPKDGEPLAIVPGRGCTEADGRRKESVRNHVVGRGSPASSITTPLERTPATPGPLAVRPVGAPRLFDGVPTGPQGGRTLT
jgi:hypothetical protein